MANCDLQRQEIKELESTAQILEPDPAQRRAWLGEVAAYAERFLESIPTAPAWSMRPDQGEALYSHPLTEQGTPVASVLGLLADNVDSNGINPTSGRFLGYIPGGGIFPSALGDYLAAITNRYSGHFFASPGAVRMENMLLRWMADTVGYPETSAGNLTSGGSLATLSAVVTARDSLGIAGDLVARSVVYATEHVHHCLTKALHVAGLGSCPRREVEMDAGFRMKPDDLKQKIAADRASGLRPFLVVASAGTTNTGAVDPIAEINALAREHELWLHVDGAYGGFFILCPEGREVLGNMNLGDSLVMDPHKTLFLPYGTGAVLVRDQQKLYSSNAWQASYTQDFPEKIEELSPADLSPEMTRHFRGLRLWLPLKLFGIAPFRAALSEKIRLARYFYEKLAGADGFEPGPRPELSIVTFRYVPKRGDPETFNRLLTKTIQQEGRIFFSSTRIAGKVVLRLACNCFRTHLGDIDEALAVLQSTAKRLSAEEL